MRVSMPLPHETELAPQLATTVVAEVALVAVHRALTGTHPILDMPARSPPCLTPTERIAEQILRRATELGELLFDYRLAVQRHLEDDTDPDLPF
jgi:hypothetical protein